jgi:hypothetical protein
VNLPLFSGIVENALQNDIKTFDCKTTENLLFFFDGTSNNKRTHFIESILKHIAENSWVGSGEFKDHMLLTRCLAQNPSVAKDTHLLQQLE